MASPEKKCLGRVSWMRKPTPKAPLAAVALGQVLKAEYISADVRKWDCLIAELFEHPTE
jgi:hypothetical protein